MKTPDLFEKRFGYRALLEDSFNGWLEHDDMRLSAALSYYTVFSLGPLLILATGVVGLWFGEDAARGALQGQLESLLGRTGAEAVQALVASARKKESGVIASIVGAVVLAVGATGVFTELKGSLNLIWKATPKKSTGALGFIKDRLLSFAMVLAVGFLLLVSLLLSTAVAAFAKFAASYLPFSPILLQAMSFVIPFIMTTVLFALMFKVLPDRPVPWENVWPGAALTSLLFAIGKFFIGLYLGQSAVLSSYGASGSVVAVMLWAYYSSAIFFFGAELTRAHADRREKAPRLVLAAA